MTRGTLHQPSQTPGMLPTTDFSSEGALISTLGLFPTEQAAGPSCTRSCTSVLRSCCHAPAAEPSSAPSLERARSPLSVSRSCSRLCASTSTSESPKSSSCPRRLPGRTELEWNLARLAQAMPCLRSVGTCQRRASGQSASGQMWVSQE